MTTPHKAIITAVVAVAVVLGIYEGTQVSKQHAAFSVAYGQTPTVPYTVEFADRSQWYPRNQAEADERVEVRVSVGLNQAMIQSRSPTNEKLCPITWATSPFRTQEWVAAFPPLFTGTNGFGSNRFDTLMIDQRPYRIAMDEGTRLALALYVPTVHQTFPGCSQRDVFLNTGESFGYSPAELTLQIRNQPLSSRELPVQIAVYSPKYFYRYAPIRIPLQGLPRWLSKYFASYRIKVPFEGPPFDRKLWEISIQQYTNWYGLLLPLRFSYKRYGEPQMRAKLQSDRVIVSVDGAVTSITQGATADINPQLQSDVSVADFRPLRELRGNPAKYQAECGKWPVVGTAEYRKMVRTNAAALAKQLGR